ncbi:low temperature requirement protein A [Arthrobacter sp. MDT3-24]
MRQIAADNLGSAVLIVIAGFVEGPADWWLWGAAAALHVGLLELGRYSNFSLWPNHFVERNGTVLIVPLGDSMVALGLGIGSRVLSPSLIIAAPLGLGLAATLWTLYFAEADTASDRALQVAPRERVVPLAGLAFGYAFIPILGGIVMISASLVDVLEHPFDHIPLTAAVFLAGRARIYVAGVAAFRQSVAAAGVAAWLDSAVATAACAATTWVGANVLGIAQVALIVGILFALSLASRRSRSSALAAASDKGGSCRRAIGSRFQRDNAPYGWFALPTPVNSRPRCACTEWIHIRDRAKGPGADYVTG